MAEPAGLTRDSSGLFRASAHELIEYVCKHRCTFCDSTLSRDALPSATEEQAAEEIIKKMCDRKLLRRDDSACYAYALDDSGVTLKELIQTLGIGK